MATPDSLKDALMSARQLMTDDIVTEDYTPGLLEEDNTLRKTNGGYNAIQAYDNYDYNQQIQEQYYPQPAQQTRKTNLPPEIADLVAGKPDMSVPGLNGSVLDSVMMNEDVMMAPPMRKPNRSAVQRPTSNNSGGGNIDYSLIKSLIDESIHRNIEELKSNMLNENCIPKLTRIKGNVIQVVDNKGNLFEGKLVLKGNINKKK